MRCKPFGTALVLKYNEPLQAKITKRFAAGRRSES